MLWRTVLCVTTLDIKPYSIAVDEAVLLDLRDRIKRTRWPDHVEGSGWDYGTDGSYLRELVTSWAEDFDWGDQERRLNRFAHYRAQIDGLGVHFVHERGKGPNPLPIVLTHGWPSSFVEHLDLVPLLTDPVAHGGRPEDSFDVVVTSMPGFGFSDRPTVAGVFESTIADMWSRLMSDGLGYQQFGAHGSDVGSRRHDRAGTAPPRPVTRRASQRLQPGDTDTTLGAGDPRVLRGAAAGTSTRRRWRLLTNAGD